MKHITLLASMAMFLPAVAQINDGSFEGGSPSTAWTEASTNFDTPLCDPSCSNNPIFGPRTGTWYAWFGGAGGSGVTLPEIASIEQTVNIPTGTNVTLGFYCKLPAASTNNNDRLDILVDGNVVATIDNSDAPGLTNYTAVGIDINAFAGASHVIKMEGRQHDGTSIFNVLVDDVVILTDGGAIGLFENESLPGFQVYPNPANEVINLSFNALQGRAVVSIFDATGKVVDSSVIGEVNRRIFQFDAKRLQNGAYFVMVENNGQRYTQRLVVTH